MMQRREHSLRRPLILIFATLVGLSAGACDDPVDIPNATATVPAVGNIDGPVEGCGNEIVTQDAGADADVADATDVSADVGADVSTDADAETDVGADADAGTDAGADAGAGADADAGTDAGEFAPGSVRLTRDGNALVIPYLLQDREGDDQRITVELCEWNGSEAVSCGVAVQSAGGDGTNFVPTTPAGTCVLHVFYWNVGCGRFVATDGEGTPQPVFLDDVDQELVAQVSVVGSDDEPTQTEPFTLGGIGFESVPECN